MRIAAAIAKVVAGSGIQWPIPCEAPARTGWPIVSPGARSAPKALVAGQVWGCRAAVGRGSLVAAPTWVAFTRSRTLASRSSTSASVIWLAALPASAYTSRKSSERGSRPGGGLGDMPPLIRCSCLPGAWRSGCVLWRAAVPCVPPPPSCLTSRLFPRMCARRSRGPWRPAPMESAA